MPLLVVNCGSSSIKYRLYHGRLLDEILSGSIEGIGAGSGRHIQRLAGEDGQQKVTEHATSVPDHRAGLEQLFTAIGEPVACTDEPLSIAHRVVHGGTRYRGATLISPEVLVDLHQLSALAPLHNPINLAGIEVASVAFPGATQVAVFDTAFHQTMPPHAYLYGVPRDWYQEHQVRRYGFHGISHRYITHRTAEIMGKPVAETTLISLHLGNGSSAAAIRNGISIDTSMGMTPLPGLMMGTRCGDLDPSILFFMLEHGDLSVPQLETLLNEASGLKGLAGESDIREVIALANAGDQWAREALDVYYYSVRKFIGAFSAVLGAVDALVFTGGIGENNAEVRAGCCDGLEHLGLVLDARQNDSIIGEPGEIQARQSQCRILVVPTNEELQIAEEALSLLSSTG